MYPQYVNIPPAQQKTYHLFISHSWDYGDDRTNLGDLILKGLGTNNVLDYAAPKDHPIHATEDDKLVEAIFDRVSKSEVLIFPAGVYASHSKWIPVELAIAKVLNKPIIAVETWGSQRSTSLTDVANEIVGWNASTIGRAIKNWHA